MIPPDLAWIVALTLRCREADLVIVRLARAERAHVTRPGTVLRPADNPDRHAEVA